MRDLPILVLARVEFLLDWSRARAKAIWRGAIRHAGPSIAAAFTVGPRHLTIENLPEPRHGFGERVGARAEQIRDVAERLQ
jgi:hypothetical protein